MIKRIFRYICRRPISALAVVLFAGVLATALCYLHRSAEEEMQSYQESYDAVPVFMKVTELDGTKIKRYEGLEGWIIDIFTDRGLQPNLAPFVSELHLRATCTGNYYVTDENGNYVLNKYGSKILKTQTTTGVSSTRVAEELTEGWGGKIYWNEGYDESILASDEFVCIVPESMKYMRELEMIYQYSYNPSGVMGGGNVETKFEHKFQVVGYYTDPGNVRIYCPYSTIEYIHGSLRKSKSIEAMGALLNDNNQLTALKEAAAQWFAEPNPLGEQTPWGRFGYEYYLYALDIDDTMLTNLEYSMKNSIRLNQIASAIVFVLSAGAGFLTGFLVIRARKREIALMRTMGASNPSIFTELALEQFLCVAAGVALGGSSFLWQPAGRLCIFGAIYFIGLAVALVVFLKKNLLTTIKEDE